MRSPDSSIQSLRARVALLALARHVPVQVMSETMDGSTLERLFAQAWVRLETAARAGVPRVRLVAIDPGVLTLRLGLGHPSATVPVVWLEYDDESRNAVARPNAAHRLLAAAYRPRRGCAPYHRAHRMLQLLEAAAQWCGRS